MKRLTKTLSSLIASLLLSFSGLIGLGVVHATGAASMYLSPSSGSQTTGSTLSVDIYENSGGTSTNAVQANLSYPASLLTYAGFSNSSAFSFDVQDPAASDTTGTLDFGRGTTSAVSGAQLVVTVKFTVKAAGTANLSFAAGSSVVNAADASSETLTTSSGSYTLSAPAAPTNNNSGTSSNTGSSSTSGSSSKSSGTSKPSGSASNTTPTSEPSTSRVTITDIKVSGLGNTSATISWQTSAATTSEVDYGPTTSYGASAVDSTMTTQHKVTLDSKNLLAGTLFHFTVKGTDSTGAVTASSDMTFRTTGGQSPAKTAPKNTSTLSWILIAVGIIVLATIFILARLTLIKRRQVQAELDHHFPKLPGNGTPPPAGSGPPGSVINPNSPPPKE